MRETTNISLLKMSSHRIDKEWTKILILILKENNSHFKIKGKTKEECTRASPNSTNKFKAQTKWIKYHRGYPTTKDCCIRDL